MLRGLEWEIQTAQSAIIGLPVCYRTYRRDIFHIKGVIQKKIKREATLDRYTERVTGK